MSNFNVLVGGKHRDTVLADYKKKLATISDDQQSRLRTSTSSIRYSGLEIETRAYREPEQSEKATFSYQESLERLLAAGYDRHLSAREALSAKMRLKSKTGVIWDDIANGTGEWLNLIANRKDGTITFGENPRFENGQWVSDTYHRFDDNGWGHHEWLLIGKLKDPVVKYLFGKTVNRLPYHLACTRLDFESGSTLAPVMLAIIPTEKDKFNDDAGRPQPHLINTELRAASRGVRESEGGQVK